jgi:thiamine pyrophosphokinase
LTIWPSSAPTAAAASSAVWVDSENTRTSSATPLRAAASTTRWIGRGNGVSDTAGVYTSGPPERRSGRGTIRAMTPPRDHRGPAFPIRALVVADGDVPARLVLDAAWQGWDARFDLVVAADGGLRRAAAVGLSPDVLVGDLDSLDAGSLARSESAGLPIVRAPVDKDESDTELALLEAVRRGATRVTVLGALGGRRLDHALANVWLLAHPDLEGIDIELLDAGARVSLVSAPGPDGRPVTRALPGTVGAVISLLPFGGDAHGVTTRGLRYPLADELLVTGPARGLSNVRIAADASVRVRSGRLVIVEAAPAAAGLSSSAS